MQSPPFCPHLLCKLHRKDHGATHWYYREGHYTTRCRGKVQRFRCRICGKYFSEQTFHTDYYAKRIIDYRELMKKIVSTSSIRDIARDFNITTGTALNKMGRLARQAIAAHEELKQFISTKDDVVIDGFESFTLSQYFPSNIHHVALKRSQFLYYSNYVTIRRKGRMTGAQKKRRKELEKYHWAPGRGIQLSFLDVLDQVMAIKEHFSGTPLRIDTDEKKDYVLAMRFHKPVKKLLAEKRLVHVQTNSRKPRTKTNPLFAVNYLDREVRKDMSNHGRETVCFSRNVNNCMEKHQIYQFYHNYIKIFREKDRFRERITHGEVAGIGRDKIDDTVASVFERRRFLSLERVHGFVRHLWKRCLFSPMAEKVGFIPKYLLA